MMNPGSTGDSSRKSSFRSSSHPSSKDGESSLKMGNIVWKRPKVSDMFGTNVCYRDLNLLH